MLQLGKVLVLACNSLNWRHIIFATHLTLLVLMCASKLDKFKTLLDYRSEFFMVSRFGSSKLTQSSNEWKKDRMKA